VRDYGLVVECWTRQSLPCVSYLGCAVCVCVCFCVCERLRSLGVCVRVLQERGVIATNIVFDFHEPGKCNVCGIMDWQVRVS